MDHPKKIAHKAGFLQLMNLLNESNSENEAESGEMLKEIEKQENDIMALEEDQDDGELVMDESEIQDVEDLQL